MKMSAERVALTEELAMATLIVSLQLIAIAGLIFGAVIVGWRAGDRFWSSR
jgi:hypothetical protein